VSRRGSAVTRGIWCPVLERHGTNETTRGQVTRTPAERVLFYRRWATVGNPSVMLTPKGYPAGYRRTHRGASFSIERVAKNRATGWCSWCQLTSLSAQRSQIRCWGQLLLPRAVPARQTTQPAVQLLTQCPRNKTRNLQTTHTRGSGLVSDRPGICLEDPHRRQVARVLAGGPNKATSVGWSSTMAWQCIRWTELLPCCLPPSAISKGPDGKEINRMGRWRKKGKRRNPACFRLPVPRRLLGVMRRVRGLLTFSTGREWGFGSWSS
jgi:hypothetical protein